MKEVSAMTESKALAPGALNGLKVIDLTRVLGGPYRPERMQWGK